MIDDIFEPPDLIASMRLGVEHIFNALDRERDFAPYFGWVIMPQGPGSDAPPWAEHAVEGDYPHVPGRFLDALARCHDIADMPPDHAAEDGLARIIHRVFADDGLPYSTGLRIDGEPKTIALMHDSRETLLALIALHRWRSDEGAFRLARPFLRKLEELSREKGHFPSHVYDGRSWTESAESPTTTVGRMISSLLLYASVSGDVIGVELAARFARVMQQGYFTDDGEVTPKAGIHLHSIEGTMTGLIEYGLRQNDRDAFELGKRMYDRGLRRWRMETGWAQEFTSWTAQSRGEANNTTDFIEAAMLLAEGNPRYYDDVEKMVRNGLLRYQFRDVSWIHTPAKEPPSTLMRTYHDIAGRIRGAFAFALPNDMHSYNADLTGGALQGLCETWHAAIHESEGRTRMNLFFSCSSDAIDVKSRLPREAQLDLKIRKDTRLLVRQPAWAERVRFRSNGALTDAPVHDSYADLGDRRAGQTIAVLFDPLREYETEETVAPGTYRIRWRADTVIGIDPPGKVAPLYPALKTPSPDPV